MSDIEAQLANIQQSIQVLQQMIENINCRTIVGKEQNKVKYMLDLKKSKQLSSSEGNDRRWHQAIQSQAANVFR